MTLENLTRITNGVGLTSPLVSSITGFAFEASKVKHGNAYICKDETNISQALENGAYAIIFEDITKVEDEEIAWIKVDSITTALFRLMRFLVSKKNLEFIYTSFLQKNILKNIRIFQKILGNDIKSIFLDILETQKDSFQFCTNLEIIKQIAPLHKSIYGSLDIKAMQGSTLFQSTFIHKDVYYKSLTLSPIFINDFCIIIEFLNKNNISFKIDPFKEIEHFEPLFVNKSLHVQAFGSTENALIVESDCKLFESEINYINQNHPSLKIFTCKPSNSTCKVEVDFTYEKEEELKNLNVNDFRYALVLGDKEKIIEELNKTLSFQASLF